MITIYSQAHLEFHASELTEGQYLLSAESPARARAIHEAIAAVGLGEILPPADHGLTPLRRVHSDAYLAFVRTAYAEWRQTFPDSTLPVPVVRPLPGTPTRDPSHIYAKLGRYTAGEDSFPEHTWTAAYAAAQVALTGQDLIHHGARSAYALCRPPGHHAAPESAGGYCYLNNAAIAVEAWVADGARVAVLDVDYHHGNGSQTIFYSRHDVLFVSLHADPAADFPYFLGYADENGVAAGEGFNFNYPLPLGTEWSQYGAALVEGIGKIRAFAPDVVVVSLGVDTSVEDPDRFLLRPDDFLRMGEAIGSTGIPTLFVQEGGYNVDVIGRNVVNVLRGFEESG